jgi:hypothetical protein
LRRYCGRALKSAVRNPKLTGDRNVSYGIGNSDAMVAYCVSR